MSALCPPCQAARTAWLDYRLPPARGFAHGSGAAYDVSAAGIRDARRSRLEQWRSTIRLQMDLIAQQCRAAGHTSEVPADRVIELDVLAAIDPGVAA